VIRYKREKPGELVYLDIKKLRRATLRASVISPRQQAIHRVYNGQSPRCAGRSDEAPLMVTQMQINAAMRSASANDNRRSLLWLTATNVARAIDYAGALAALVRLRLLGWP
jgi:hypothetical protein